MKPFIELENCENVTIQNCTPSQGQDLMSYKNCESVIIDGIAVPQVGKLNKLTKIKDSIHPFMMIIIFETTLLLLTLHYATKGLF